MKAVTFLEKSKKCIKTVVFSVRVLQPQKLLSKISTIIFGYFGELHVTT